ncbi:MAG: hypothetical protein PUC14_06945 [Bacteroidales bacterium]|nr:hypothetical protein [Bacteroidales bacterium]
MSMTSVNAQNLHHADMDVEPCGFTTEWDKTIIPLCTHGGSRFSGAINTLWQGLHRIFRHRGSRFSGAINAIRNLEKGATVIEGIAVPREQVARSKEEVLTWLKQIGMIE